MEQEPGRELHETGGEAHAFGGVSQRGIALQPFRFLPAKSIEISRSLLDQSHAAAEEVCESLRAGDPLAKRNSSVDRLLGHRYASRYFGLFCFCANPGGAQQLRSAGLLSSTRS